MSPATKQEVILEFIRENGAPTKKDISNATGISYHLLDEPLRKLLFAGEIIRHPVVRNGFTVPENGMAGAFNPLAARRLRELQDEVDRLNRIIAQEKTARSPEHYDFKLQDELDKKGA